MRVACGCSVWKDDRSGVCVYSLAWSLLGRVLFSSVCIRGQDQGPVARTATRALGALVRGPARLATTAPVHQIEQKCVCQRWPMPWPEDLQARNDRACASDDLIEQKCICWPWPRPLSENLPGSQ